MAARRIALCAGLLAGAAASPDACPAWDANCETDEEAALLQVKAELGQC